MSTLVLYFAVAHGDEENLSKTLISGMMNLTIACFSTLYPSSHTQKILNLNLEHRQHVIICALTQYQYFLKMSLICLHNIWSCFVHTQS